MPRHRRTEHGITLAVVFMVIAIALVFCLTLAGGAVFQINVAQSTINRSQALNLAESAVAQGAAAVIEAVLDQQPVNPTLTLSGATGPGTLSYLSFNPSNPAALPWSCNNLTGVSPVFGFVPGQMVPRGAVQLVGTGLSGSESARVEAVIHFPAFPFVVASSGSFQSPLGGVTIAQVASQFSLSSGLAGLPASAILPGDMASNSTGTPAVLLGTHSKVSGNVQASGSITLEAGASVLGAVQPYAQPVALPTINVNNDPTAGYGGVVPLTSPPCANPITLEGLARGTGSVTIPGDLILNGAVVYVHGDLTIGGALQGTGAVFTSGSLSVAGGAHLTATDMMALVAGGDVTLDGPPDQSAVFFGLVYTQGNLTANNMQLYGNFVANGSPGGTGGNVTMNNCTLSYVDDVVDLDLGGTILSYCPGSTCSSGGGGGGSNTFTVTGYEINTNGTCPLGMGCQRTGGGKKPVSTYCAVHTGKCVVPICFTITKNSCGTYTVSGSSQALHSSCYCFEQCHGLHIQTTPQPCCKQGFSLTVTCPKLLAKLICGLTTQDWGRKPCGAKCTKCCPGWACAALKQLCAGLSGLCKPPQPGPPPPPTVVGPLVRVTPGSTGAQNTVLNFNFNQFISPADQVRLLLWARLQ